ncbi:MAG: regulatory protein RecX [Gammaproteobacteria bacterium]|nr:regulatory protein RecX [Gammaproteobacteria bacterium]
MTVGEVLEETLVSDEGKEIYKSALNLLARREHTELELRKKYLKRGFKRADIDPVIEQLKAGGQLSLERFLDDFLHNRLQRNVGPLKITSDLRSRGVTESEIEEALDKTDPDWVSMAKRALKKRRLLHGKNGFIEPKSIDEWRTAHRVLRNQGYTDWIILNLLGHPPY